MARISNFFNCEINSVLINRYKDGNSYIPWHQDDEPELGESPSIYSLSLGDARVFEIKNKDTNKTIKFKMFDGTLIVMKGAMQRQWYHRVPKSQSHNVRLNFTFRLTKKL